jgi:HrpA-like RNA helicase
MATEKVTVYGLPIVAARKVNYSQIDPALCRELFIRHALVEGDWQTRHAFFRENLKLRAKSKSWSINRAAATFWWMTKRCSSSTTSASATT